jgi:hypothetical protein
MEQKRTTTRPAIFFLVVAVHLGLVALILMSSRTMNVAGSAKPPIQLVYLEPVKAPRILADKNRSRFLDPRMGLSQGPPLVNASLPTGLASVHDGRGSAVNWAAEAHRAVRAFEIRRDQSGNSAQSVSSSMDDAGPHGHHAEYSRTAEGDWIVWISADCYKVASWNSGASAFAVLSAQMFCRNSDEEMTTHED